MTDCDKADAATKERSPDEPLSKQELDKQLDHALKETFPSSDPIAVGQPTGTEVLDAEHAPPAADEHPEEAPGNVPVQAPEQEKKPMRKAPRKRDKPDQKPK